MRFLKGSLMGVMAAVLASAEVVLADPAPVATLAYVEGHVMSPAEGSRKLEPVSAGRALGWGEMVVTGDVSRYEVRPAQGGGLWRVGRRAVFALKDGGARLLAGTALVLVPEKALWRVESLSSVATLPTGTWIVQAMENRGLKILCLDGGAQPVQAWGDVRSPATEATASVRLRTGELSFLQPGGKVFSPIATIFLQETLATSRLVNGFPEPVPGMKRLMNQAIAQQERLSKLSNAVIVGASQAGSFQVAVPNAPTPEKPKP